MNLAAGGAETIDIVSATAFVSCGVYDNTATLTATNAPSPAPAKATTTVQCADVTLTAAGVGMSARTSGSR